MFATETIFPLWTKPTFLLQANGLHHTVLAEGRKYATLWDAGEVEVRLSVFMSGHDCVWDWTVRCTFLF